MAYQLHCEVPDEALYYLNLKNTEDDIWCLTQALKHVEGSWDLLNDFIAALKSGEDDIINPLTPIEKN